MNLTIFLRRPILASVVSLIIMFCGIVALFNLPVSQFPDISPPSIQINASYPGANAETAARVVAAQIENQMNGVSGLTYMATSTSSVGNVSITLTYDVGTNLNYAINEVLNRLQAAMPLLPSVVQQMGVTARKSSPDMLLLASFYSDPYIDPKFVTNYLQRTVENDLLLLPTVGTISVFGTGSYAIRIWLDPNKMQRYGVTVTDLQNIIEDQNEENYVGRSNASPNSVGNNLVFNLKGNEMYSTPEQFANMVIRNQGNQTIRMKDVARVELGSSSYSTIAELNFRDKNNKFRHYPCTVMQIFLTPGANQLEAKKEILARLDEDSKRFPYGLSYQITVDNSRFVAASVRNVVDTLKIAFALVGIVIFIFLGNIRASLIAIFSIPVSIIGTMACLYMVGFSLNTLSLFALILAIGIVVDDSIVIVENIERLRAEHPALPLKKIVAMTLEEVFGAVFAIVLVLSVVFIPAMGLNGLSGNMFRQFAVTIACAVVLSGICALTFTPAMSCLILKKTIQKTQAPNWFDRNFEKLTDFYVMAARWFIEHRKIAMLSWLIVVIATGMLFKIIPKAFVPNEDQGLIFSTINLPSSSSLQDTNDKAHKIIEKLTKNPAIDSVITVAGFDFLDSGNQKTFAASFFISLKDWALRKQPGSDADTIIKQLNTMGYVAKDMVVRAFNQPVIRGLSTTGGIEFYVEDRVVGDPHQLQAAVDDLIKKIKAHKEVGSSFQTLDTNVLETSILPNIAMATFYGVDLQNLYTSIQTIYSNNNVNYAYIMQDLVWVIMQADYPFRATIDKIRNVYIHSSTSNTMVPISSVVSIKDSRDAQIIQRFNGYMASKVVVNPSPGHSFGDAMNAIVAEAGNLDKRYTYEWYGTSYQLTLSQKTASLAFLFSIIMIYLVLCALYEMWRLPLVVLMGIPFALFGALGILLISGKQNDLYFQISLLALLGLSAKNIILLVEFALQHFNAGNDIVESALFALKLRFRPIVMTSATFIFGTLPLAFAKGAGANAQHSVGIGIIGGILGSIFLASLLTPAYFVMIMQNYKRRVNPDDDN
ncbi:MAG: efflux RND transporter permease subunit [Burkholderiales bacterium]|nr:efflux RND transporter permease subunit [Burkholderiales bacterium]